MAFDPKETKNELIAWIRDWFEENGRGCNAIVGISGGKNSSICAALCVEALGRDRVVGILMPNLKQDDIGDSYQLVSHLDIKNFTIPISIAVASIHNQLEHEGIEVSTQTTMDLPSRIRMSVLYAVSQSMNGRVVNTYNLTEGVDSRNVGDIFPLSCMTTQEIKAIGKELGLPDNLIDKPSTNDLYLKAESVFEYKI